MQPTQPSGSSCTSSSLLHPRRLLEAMAVASRKREEREGRDHSSTILRHRPPPQFPLPPSGLTLGSEVTTAKTIQLEGQGAFSH